MDNSDLMRDFYILDEEQEKGLNVRRRVFDLTSKCEKQNIDTLAQLKISEYQRSHSSHDQ